MRYKIGFTIEAETLFRLAAKMLPIGDVTIEEVTPPKQAPSPTVMAAVLRRVKFDSVAKVKRLKPKRRWRRGGPNLDHGVNKVLMSIFADGNAHRAVEFKQPLADAGYSRNSVGSRLAALAEYDIIWQPGKGDWKLASKEPIAE